jgi:hypothetical protein
MIKVKEIDLDVENNDYSRPLEEVCSLESLTKSDYDIANVLLSAGAEVTPSALRSVSPHTSYRYILATKAYSADQKSYFDYFEPDETRKGRHVRKDNDVRNDIRALLKSFDKHGLASEGKDPY